MKINEIIKERRTAKNFTQEQVAEYLGVTTPAVNKWEKGNSYPDITLLPALARLLDTDLNTLLSFSDDLSEKEIAIFMNDLAEYQNTHNFEEVYKIATNKIKEFPSCYLLILNMALFLDGALMMNSKINNIEYYENNIEKLYQRAMQSKDLRIQNHAKSILISKLINHNKYDDAQELLDSLPEKGLIDKKDIQAKLYIKVGKLDDAAKIEEEKLMSLTTEINQTLVALMEIGIKDNRMEDAEYIANVSQEASNIFDLWEYNSYMAKFQLYYSSKNKMKCLKILLPMLKSLNKKWDINTSPLYKHIKTKEIDKTFGTKMQKSVISSIANDSENDFLNKDSEFEKLLKEYND